MPIQRQLNMGLWKSISTAILGLLFSEKVCYHEEGIGCFHNKSPYDNVQGILPQSPQQMQVEFLLYTRKKPTTPQIISRESASIAQSNFNGSLNTRFIIHGYNDHATETWVKDMGQALLNTEDANVIAVNWAIGAAQTDYRQAAANARVVGALIAEFMKSLNKSSQANFDSMHLIGHSLGAHVAGYAGERVPGTGRITGLDPAGPLFENKGKKVRLDPSDAEFVDVIHTDGDSLLELGFGLETVCGHADFYPNGGTNQPGCQDDVLKNVFNLVTGKIKALKKSVSCSHMRATKLFTETIKTPCRCKAYPCADAKQFKAGKCSSCQSGCAIMGLHAEKSKHGTFYLTTESSPPFCRVA